jgi:hypothetical protein
MFRNSRVIINKSKPSIFLNAPRRFSTAPPKYSKEEELRLKLQDHFQSKDVKVIDISGGCGR